MKLTSKYSLLCISIFLLVGTGSSALPSVGFAQDQGLQATEFIEDNQTVELTFHKVVNGQKSAALDLTDPDLKFFTGELVRVEYKAPFDSYIYIVNATTSGRTEVQYPRRSELNVRIPANQAKGFSFRLTNRKGLKGPIKEDLVFVVSRTQVNNPTLNELLANYAQLDELSKEIEKGSATAQQKEQVKQLQNATKLSDPPAEFKSVVQTMISKKSGGPKVVKVAKVVGKIACTVASSWLGGLFKTACGTGIFGAAEFEEDESNIVYGSPDGKSEKLFIRLSFEHEARS